jgi:hypothetical protein
MQYGYSEHCRQVFEMAFCKHFNIDYQNAPGWVVREALGKNGIKISVSTRDVKKRDLNKGEKFQDFSAFLKPENLALYAHHRMMHEKDFQYSGIDKNCYISLVRGELEYTPFESLTWF